MHTSHKIITIANFKFIYFNATCSGFRDEKNLPAIKEPDTIGKGTSKKQVMGV